MATRGKPPGTSNKIKVSPGMFMDMLKAKGIDLIESSVREYEMGDAEIRYKYWKEWMRYCYAPRRAEDGAGNPEEAAAVQVVAFDEQRLIEMIRTARAAGK